MAADRVPRMEQMAELGFYGLAGHSDSPRDLVEQVTSLCHYRGEEPRITRELLDAAADRTPGSVPISVSSLS